MRVHRILGENGYLQKTAFKESPGTLSYPNLEGLTNRGYFSEIWWAKFFGLYSCLNNVNGFSQKMYFGSDDLVKDKSAICSKNGCALEIIKAKVCKQNGLFGKDGDYSYQALLVMMNRVNDVDFNCEKEVVECHQWSRLVLLHFIMQMIRTIHNDEEEWIYEYDKRGLKQDDNLWRKLFLQTNNDTFDTNNLWQIYADKQGADSGKKKSKHVLQEVNFTDKCINPWAEKINLTKRVGYQRLKSAGGRGMLVTLNRLPIFVNKKRVDVVEVLQTFFLNSLVSRGDLTFSEFLDENSVLLTHIKYCMVQFTTYFMTGDVTNTDPSTKKDIDEMEIVAAMIVEKNVRMTNNKERVLLHYICVAKELCRDQLATALMTTVFKKREFYDKELMAVTALPSRYRHDEDTTTMVKFFSTFDFEQMPKRIVKDGVNDVDKIILPGATVQLGLCNKIAEKR